MNFNQHGTLGELSVNTVNETRQNRLFGELNFIDAFRNWRERARTRQRINELDRRQLNDIGLDRSQF